VKNALVPRWGDEDEKAMNVMGQRLAGVLLVLALHGAVIYGLWGARLIPSPLEQVTLFVNFIAAPEVVNPAPPKHLPAPKPVKKSSPQAIEPPRPKPPVQQPQVQQPQPLAAQVPAAAQGEAMVLTAEPKAAPTPVKAAGTAPALSQAPQPPVALSTELSLACPQREAPGYPSLSRRLGEVGRVLLRAELSETGEVTSVRVLRSSGFNRLDNAALTAVRRWHCTPPTRNGQAVRATAVQPFDFVLEGN